MKYQVLSSLKNNEKIFMNVVCCSRDWRFKGNFVKMVAKCGGIPYSFSYKPGGSFPNNPKNS